MHMALREDVRWMLTASLVVNIVVLAPLCTCIGFDLPRIEVVYGKRSPARDILLAIYLAILVASILLLGLLHVAATQHLAGGATAALITVQIIYKCLTALVVRGGFPPGRTFNPVVVANVVIAAFHASSLGLWLSSTLVAVHL
jgi:hypothetical protein